MYPGLAFTSAASVLFSRNGQKRYQGSWLKIQTLPVYP